MNENSIAISVKNVSKSFKLPHEQTSGIKQVILNVFNKNKERGYEIQQVLNGVSFDIQKGDFFGIVGRNGSGKSTLLKLLAGIYTPEDGEIVVNGSLVPFIELGVGFNPELTGRENVYMNGALLGFSNKQMDSMYNEIVEFAELEKFMDQKLKNYSSGMQVRLAFSIAIRAEGDILVLDEVLAVGDEAFQRKCSDYFAKMKKSKQTVVLVTHDMSAVRKYCNKAVLIRDGEVVLSGSPDAIASEYSMDNLPTSKGTNIEADPDETSPIKDFKFELLNSKKISQDEEVKINISYKTRERMATKVGVSLLDINREAPIFGSVSPETTDQDFSMILTTKLPYINDTSIKVNVTVRNENDEFIYYLKESAVPSFIVSRTDYKGKNPSKYALLFDRGEWSK
jgi:ABC-2 type transport system ATP-binding protein